MALRSKYRLYPVMGALAMGYWLSLPQMMAQSFAASPPRPAFPMRSDVATVNQFESFERTDRERIKSYLHLFPWLYDAGWAQARQEELFLYFFAKLKHETTPPFTGEQNLFEWRTARHRKAYTTSFANGQLQVSDPNAAWELIVEDLKVCAPILNNEVSEARRKEAFAVVAADMPLIGAILGDDHAARLTYEGFLLPYLDLANPGSNVWPAQGQILLDNYVWLTRDESSDKVGDVSRMMIRYGEEDYDARYAAEMADITRYLYGGYLKSKGQPLSAISYWRAIKTPHLLAGAEALYKETEEEQKNSLPSLP